MAAAGLKFLEENRLNRFNFKLQIQCLSISGLAGALGTVKYMFKIKARKKVSKEKKCHIMGVRREVFFLATSSLISDSNRTDSTIRTHVQ